MDPLDLRVSAPRAPRERAGGIVFLPRTIDKARASLPGGNLGRYRMGGFSEDMLERFGIAVDTFVAEVAKAHTDDDVAAFVHAHANPVSIEPWNDYVLTRRPFGGENAERAKAVFPFMDDRPDLVLAVDLLEEDDRRFYALPK